MTRIALYQAQSGIDPARNAEALSVVERVGEDRCKPKTTPEYDEA